MWSKHLHYINHSEWKWSERFFYLYSRRFYRNVLENWPVEHPLLYLLLIFSKNMKNDIKKLFARMLRGAEQWKFYFKQKCKTSEMKNRVLLHYGWSFLLIEAILCFFFESFVCFPSTNDLLLEFSSWRPFGNSQKFPRKWFSSRRRKFPEATSTSVQGRTREINFSTSLGCIVHSAWFSFAMQMLLLYFIIHLIEFQISFLSSFPFLFESFHETYFQRWRRLRTMTSFLLKWKKKVFIKFWTVKKM